MTRLMLCCTLVLTLACSPERDRWEEARAENTGAAYAAFLMEFPDGAFADSARLGIETIHFEETTSENTLDAYETFLTQHPGGHFSDSASRLLEAAYFELAQASNNVAAFTDLLERFPDGSLTDTVQAILDEIYPAFSTEELLEVSSISGIVGTGECTFTEGSEPNTVSTAIATTVPTVDGRTCFCCGGLLRIAPNLRVALDGLFRSHATRGGSTIYNINVEGMLPEGGMMIVAGPDGATLRKVGRGFVLVEGEAHLLRVPEGQAP